MLSVILYLFSFIRTLFVFVILYLAIRWIRNLISPQQTNSSSHSKRQEAQKEGETTIRFNDKGKKIVDKNEGEYVDFEEVE